MIFVGSRVRYSDPVLGRAARFFGAVVVDLEGERARLRWPWGQERAAWIGHLELVASPDTVTA